MSAAPDAHTTASLLDVARAYRAAGRSVLPIAPTTKWPSILTSAGEIREIPWKPYQSKLATEATLRTWFPPHRLMGLGIACGPVSGCVLDGIPHALEVLDIDEQETLDSFIEAAHFQGLSTLLRRLVHQRTPGGAGHFAYLCSVWEGNTKLALRALASHEPEKPIVETLIETRGAGGQVVVAPTPPGVHPDHPDRGYALVWGTWEAVPAITPAERLALWELALSFNTYIEPTAIIPDAAHAPETVHGERPGDVLNARADRTWWRTLLERHHWTLTHTRGAIQYWQRPGKEGRSWSATLGACGDLFYPFSSNADPFQPKKGYKPNGIKLVHIYVIGQ